mmetsp:Transcript_13769/g.15849  ORF Transcript_13769/g.15849 Transcript_13769/m.15849 type:complete len:185 (-) Transcript_13769:113-667(-)
MMSIIIRGLLTVCVMLQTQAERVEDNTEPVETCWSESKCACVRLPLDWGCRDDRGGPGTPLQPKAPACRCKNMTSESPASDCTGVQGVQENVKVDLIGGRCLVYLQSGEDGGDQDESGEDGGDQDKSDEGGGGGGDEMLAEVGSMSAEFNSDKAPPAAPSFSESRMTGKKIGVHNKDLPAKRST